MYFTDDSLFPENMQPTIITAAPFGPEWLPGDVEDLPVSFKDQVQAAVDCYNAGATMLHVHVRDPKTGQGSSNFDQYNEFIGMLRNAVPKMILQVGGIDLVCAAYGGRQGQVARLRHPPHADGAEPEAGLRHDHDRHDALGRDPSLHPGRCGRDAPRRPEGRGRLGRHGRGFDVEVLPRAPQAASARTRSSPTSSRATSISSRSSSGCSAPACTRGR